MDIKLLLCRSGSTYDISDLVESVTWKGRKGAAARSLDATLIDTEKIKSGIDVTRGDSLSFYSEGKELFRGLAMSQQQSEGCKMTVTAYDNAIYIANNKDTFTYNDKTLYDIFIDVCRRFGVRYSGVANTSYKISELVKQRTTAWDVIQDAISQDYRATGAKYYVHSSKGVLSLARRKENILQYVLETEGNIFSYSFKKSIEKINTRIKVLTKDDTVYAVEKDSALEKKIGIFQNVEKKDDDLSEAKLKDQIKQNLKEASTPEQSLNVNTVGIDDVISGVGVWVNIGKLGVNRTYWVDEDSHTFKGDSHTMSLKLNKNNEV